MSTAASGLALLPSPLPCSVFVSILTGNGGNGQHADEVNMVRLALRLSPSDDEIVPDQKEDEQGVQEDENACHEAYQNCPHNLRFKSPH